MLKGYAYQLKDEHVLEDLIQSLQDLCKEVKDQLPNDNGIPSASPKKKFRHSNDVKDLPTRKYGRPKHPFTGRVRDYAQKMRDGLHTKKNLEEMRSTPMPSQQSNATPSTSQQCNAKQMPSQKIITSPMPFQESDQTPGTSRQKQKRKAVIISDEEDEVQVNIYNWTEVNGPTERILLTLNDEATVQSKVGWLNDRHIGAAQQLIKAEWPFVGGLTNTVKLSSTRHLSVPAGQEAIQIIHLGNHWVTSTSIGGNITVYDSMVSQMSLNLKRQIVSMYRPYAVGSDGIINVTIKCVQKQRGGSDCGLFAIANSVALANGIPAETVL